MRKFIIRFFIYIFLLLVVEQFISSFFPYHYGNPWFSTKIEFLNKLKAEELPNTYVFGSSRVYRQLKPVIIDSILNKKFGKPTRTYNLGAPATFNPQVYYLIDNFLESKLVANTHTIFIELMGLSSISSDLMHQERSIYYINNKELMYAIKSTMHSNEFGLKKKVEIISKYSLSYCENIFNYGKYGRYLLDKEYLSEEYLGIQKDGCLLLDDQIQITTNAVTKKNLINRKNSLLKSKNKLTIRATKSNEFSNGQKTKANIIHLERITELIKKADALNIDIIFFVSPKYLNKETQNIYKGIPWKNKMQFIEAKKYPELYQINNSFDIGHLNTKGSNIYSILFALEAKKKLNH